MSNSLPLAILLLCWYPLISATAGLLPGVWQRTSAAVERDTPWKVSLQQRRTWTFAECGVQFHNRFAGARVNACRSLGDGMYEVVIEPGSEPVNNSAWYALQVTAEAEQTIHVKLVYRGGRHRYSPKISTDGQHWERLPAEAYQSGRQEAILTLRVGPQPLWVAAQELINNEVLNTWMDTLAGRPFVHASEIGRSLLDNPIRLLTLDAEADDPGYVVLIGRQHPPEVTGSIGLMHFVETLAGDTELARTFRRQFRVLVVPLVNPDGVYHGNWRHNMQGVDLNRDWGPFRQPETRAVRDQVFGRFQGDNAPQLYLCLDFHSTFHDVFYTQRDQDPMFPEQFTSRWLEGIQQRLPDYRVRRSASNLPGRPTSKNWVYQQFGVPAITYEFGDNTDRELVRSLAVESAREMMELLLQENAGRGPAD